MSRIIRSRNWPIVCSLLLKWSNFEQKDDLQHRTHAKVCQGPAHNVIRLSKSNGRSSPRYSLPIEVVDQSVLLPVDFRCNVHEILERFEFHTQEALVRTLRQLLGVPIRVRVATSAQSSSLFHRRSNAPRSSDSDPSAGPSVSRERMAVRIDEPPPACDLLRPEEAGRIQVDIGASSQITQNPVVRGRVAIEKEEDPRFPRTIRSEWRGRSPSTELRVDKHVLSGIVFPFRLNSARRSS